MLETYAKAWVMDEEMVDLIRDAWYRGEIDEDQARLAWWTIVGLICPHDQYRYI